LKELLGSYFINLYESRNITQYCVCPHGILHILPVAASIVAEIPSIDITAWSVPHASFFNNIEDIPDSESFRYIGIGVPGELKNVEEEIFEASKYFSKKNRAMIIDKKISRDRVLMNLNNADIIHFACHGVLRSDISELSYLFLGPNECLRSVDIITRAYLKAKLVILSACWTSIGRVAPSDEIGSLSRSFLYKGAEAVMATLWPIPDEGAKKFIIDFFRLWLKDKMPLKKAFCRAQKLHFNNPIVWSAFVLIEAK
jgi:CHAT domain-containing protein